MFAAFFLPVNPLLLLIFMLFLTATSLTTTEHCELDKQCNDAGCKGPRLGIRKIIQILGTGRRPAVAGLLLVWPLLHQIDSSAVLLAAAVAVAVGETKTTSRLKRGGTLEQLNGNPVQQPSMGGNWCQSCHRCLAWILILSLTTILSLAFTSTSPFTSTFTPTFVFTLSPTSTLNSHFTSAFTFTFAQLPVCRFGRMNTKVAFTVCITFTCPYRLMCLHRTISTSIRAVDDNQVCS